MRETEQFSIPMRDTTPHPTSTKAPKPSRWVTVAQVHQQIVARGAQEGPALQHGFLLHSLAEGGEGLPGGLVFWGVEQAPFWEIQVGHTLPSFLIP